MKFNRLIPELNVTNIKESLKFYVDILGFNIEYDRPEERFSFISFQGSQLMLDQIGEGRIWKTGEFKYPLGRGINFQIEVDDLDSLITNMKKNKIPFFMKPEKKWYRVGNHLEGNYQFLVQDPDGYLLRFSQDIGIKKI